MEGRQIFGSQEPNTQIDRVTTKDLWESLDNVFTKQRNKKALVDSGSVFAIINRSLATTVVSECKESFWVQSPEMHDLKTFSNGLIKIIGVIQTSIKCND